MNQSNADDLAGGIRNALDRGENIEQIKQSFMNAGYKPQDIENAIRIAMQSPQTIGQQPIGQMEDQIPEFPEAPEIQESTPQETKLGKKFWIISIIFAILILIGAGLLGLFWSEISPYFDKIVNMIKDLF